LLLLKGEIVYVGTSQNMADRVAAHRANGRPFDKVFYIGATERERLMLEELLIRRLRPRQNKNGHGP
jgi:predicted GIY-YIG superfamily endonuclease